MRPSSSPKLQEPFGTEDHRRVRLGLRLLAVAIFLGAVVEALNAHLAHQPLPLLFVAFLLSSAAMSLVTVWLIDRHGLPQGVLVGGLTLLMATIPGTMVQYAGPVVVLGPILLVALAMPYLHGRRLMALMVVAGAVTPVNVALSEFWRGPMPAAGPVPPGVLFVFFATLCVAVVLALLFLFAGRLRQLRLDEHAGRVELQQLNAQMTTMLQASPVAIAVFDPGARVVLLNPAAERLFGVTADQAVGRPLDAVLTPDDRLLELVAGAQAGQTFGPTDVEARLAGRPPLSLSIAAAPLVSGADVTGFMLLGVDATRRKKLEADVLHAQKMESVGLLAGGIAHDFNNLLTIVTAETSLMAEVNLPDSAKESVEAIEEASRRATELCKQLLSFSRRQLVQPRAHDLSELLGSIVPMLQRMVGSSITLHFTPTLQPMVAWVDRSQFEQVVLNLVVNARDAMPQGGSVYLNLDALDGKVVFTLRDTGAGMPPDVQARAFEPFFTTKEHGRGTGLGLATVKDVIERAQGTIELQSRLGEGTQFRICLPQSLVPVSEVANGLSPRAHAFRGLKVLLVDDDVQVRQVSEKILAANGAVVLTAGDAHSALALLEAHLDVKVLVTDVIMPGVNGRVLAELAVKLRPGLPVLFTSGYSTDAELAALVMRGAAHFLPKPFNRVDFEQALQRTLETSPPVPQGTVSH